MSLVANLFTLLMKYVWDFRYFDGSVLHTVYRQKINMYNIYTIKNRYLTLFEPMAQSFVGNFFLIPDHFLINSPFFTFTNRLFLYCIDCTMGFLFGYFRKHPTPLSLICVFLCDDDCGAVRCGITH
jgi:hypothetical protein